MSFNAQIPVLQKRKDLMLIFQEWEGSRIYYLMLHNQERERPYIYDLRLTIQEPGMKHSMGGGHSQNMWESAVTSSQDPYFGNAPHIGSLSNTKHTWIMSWQEREACQPEGASCFPLDIIDLLNVPSKYARKLCRLVLGRTWLESNFVKYVKSTRVFVFFVFEIISPAKSYSLHGKCLVKLKGPSTMKVKLILASPRPLMWQNALGPYP